jgi:hypothetical protein
MPKASPNAGKGGEIPADAFEDARRRNESSQGGSDRGAKSPNSPDEREKADSRRDKGGPGQQTPAGEPKAETE